MYWPIYRHQLIVIHGDTVLLHLVHIHPVCMELDINNHIAVYWSVVHNSVPTHS